jgi:hypothetical protein
MFSTGGTRHGAKKLMSRTNLSFEATSPLTLRDYLPFMMQAMAMDKRGLNPQA